MTADNLEVLTNFVVDNPDLELLEARLAEFNIFEVLGAVRQELRHSDFLGYLLDPTGNHNLGDAFLKKLLKQVLANMANATVSAVDVDVMHLDGALESRNQASHQGHSSFSKCGILFEVGECRVDGA